MRRKAWIPATAGAALLAFVGLGALAIAHSPAAGQKLLKLCAQANLSEVQLGRLALTRSSDPAVLALGARLVQDGAHQAASLRTVAAMLHVQLPAAPDGSQKQQLTQLRRLHGVEFDQRFERIALAQESMLLRQLRSGASTARNAAVRYTIRTMIPAVEERLRIGTPLTLREATATTTGVMR